MRNEKLPYIGRVAKQRTSDNELLRTYLSLWRVVLPFCVI